MTYRTREEAKSLGPSAISNTGGWTRETATGTSQPELLADPQPIDTTVPSPFPARHASPQIVHSDSS
jgi:hypothetical protein